MAIAVMEVALSDGEACTKESIARFDNQKIPTHFVREEDGEKPTVASPWMLGIYFQQSEWLFASPGYFQEEKCLPPCALLSF